MCRTIVHPWGRAATTKVGRFEADVVFDDLEPGRYAVRPAARPCSGTCDHFYGRTGECETVVDMPATTRLTVEHTIGRARTVPKATA